MRVLYPDQFIILYQQSPLTATKKIRKVVRHKKVSQVEESCHIRTFVYSLLYLLYLLYPLFLLYLSLTSDILFVSTEGWIKCKKE